MKNNSKIILFDLDGTLSDPKEGIINSVLYALKVKGLVEKHPEDLDCFIGPPLHLSFQKRYHLSPEESIEMLAIFRRYFAEKGIFENKLYPGIYELLKNLHRQNYILSLATSKPTHFAKQVLEYFKINEFISFVSGANLDGSRTDKAEVVAYAKEISGNKADEDYLMVGDREFDIRGAHANQLKACWVSYGYGDQAVVLAEKPEFVCPTVRDLSNLLLR
jgi:phosphoglycolate phosphatase